jgi:chitinase
VPAGTAGVLRLRNARVATGSPTVMKATDTGQVRKAMAAALASVVLARSMLSWHQ